MEQSDDEVYDEPRPTADLITRPVAYVTQRRPMTDRERKFRERVDREKYGRGLRGRKRGNRVERKIDD